MRRDLLAWQWSLYSDNHRDRRNLIIHIISNPLFIFGTLSVLSTPLVGLRALGGLVGMVLGLVLQGRGHKVETVAPVPFLGPLDVVTRFFAEQFVTFPRFVLSGGFARAWREAGAAPATK